MELIIAIIFIIVLFFSFSKFKSKGELGEKYVAKILKSLPEDRYKVINNLLISQDGHTTQIDHVVISVYGIFVIETKNYQGQVYGGENGDYWTQNIYGHKYKLRNPIHQNYGHIKSLKKKLDDFDNVPYISIIAFSRHASVSVSSNTPVIYWNQLLSVISQFENRVLTEPQVQTIYNILIRSNMDSRDNRKEHVKSVQSTIQRRSATINSGYCPRCGGNLIKRQGKYGNFYGCSNYPKCRYTLPC